MSEIRKPQLGAHGWTTLGLVGSIVVLGIANERQEKPSDQQEPPVPTTISCDTLTNPADIRECTFSERVAQDLHGNAGTPDDFAERFHAADKRILEYVGNEGAFTYEHARDILDGEASRRATEAATGGLLSAYEYTGLIDNKGAFTRTLAEEQIAEIFGEEQAIEIGPAEEE